MNNEIRVSITPSTIFVAILILAGVYLLWILRDLVLLVLTAIIIASAIEPGVSFFMRAKMPRLLAVLFVYILVFGSISTILYFFFPPLMSEATNFLLSMPRLLEALNLSNAFNDITAITNLAAETDESLASSLLAFQAMFTTASGGILQLFTSFFGGAFAFVLVIVLSFYFAIQDTGIDDFLRLIMPSSHEGYAVGLWRRAQKKIGLWMQGQIILSVIVGVLTYLGLLIIDVPYALLLAIFTGMATIIPIFGSIIASIIAVMVGFYDGGIAIALIVAGLYVVVNQFESNLIYPLIVKKIIGIPPLLVIVALIAGYTLAGFIGVLLSVPIAAVALEFIYDLDKRKNLELNAPA